MIADESRADLLPHACCLMYARALGVCGVDTWQKSDRLTDYTGDSEAAECRAESCTAPLHLNNTFVKTNLSKGTQKDFIPNATD